LEFATPHKEENMKGMKSVIIEGDEEIQRGDAVIKSNRGTIDCGIEKHLKMIEEELRKQSGERIREEEKEAGEAKENHGKTT
jgi:flagellar biosynthesis/type III secretory pathway protein FliH